MLSGTWEKAIKKGADKYDVLSVPCQTVVMNKKPLYLGKEIQRLTFVWILCIRNMTQRKLQ